MNKSNIAFIISLSLSGIGFSLIVIDVINDTYIYKWESLSLIIGGILIIPFIFVFDRKESKEKKEIH